jgi:rhodanese-related sulfurtransferase
VHVPRGLLEFKADSSLPTHLPDLAPDRRTILYCASGGRSALAVTTLQRLGYAHVAHLDGGIQAWLTAGRPTEMTE